MGRPTKTETDHYAPGDWNAVCYECGGKFKASELKRHWQGYYVCPKHWEARHPQDFVRGVPDEQTPPWTQPEPADQIRSTCTVVGLNGIAGYGVAGCMIAGLSIPEIKEYDPTWIA